MSQTLDSHFKKMREEAENRRVSSLAAAKERIEGEYLADLHGIERLESYSNTIEGNGSVPTIAPASSTGTKKTRDSIGPAAATREAINALPDGFTTRDVQDHIAKHHPFAHIATASIFSAMNKFKSNGEIEVIRQNQGREPGTYKRSKINLVQGFFEEKAAS